MTRRLIGLMAAALTGGVLVIGSASPAPAAPAKVKATDFHAIVALSNCSGSVVRGPKSVDSDPAMVLTNGHCSELGMPGPGQVITNRSSRRTFTLLNPSGQGSLGTLRATQIEYSTMTDTDVTLYKLNTSYASIKSRYGTDALRLAPGHPTAGTQISVVSGYWRKIYSCKIDGFVYRLKESNWTWKDSVRYTSTCDTIGGTSGSPVINDSTGQVVAVNNTGNEDGQQCTLNNPCEVDENGQVTVHQGTNYAQETYILANCLIAGSDVDLTQSSCTLPKP
ncbi:trypsin-like peptidase domain-containing protein [Actinomadura barringtoniae]|uniref:Trypsin-like peptidase domain-containing protein n=1 Tax=Actinomadura barringtoniae TaxID=1427535 RepID=A0A939PMJ0_9ACTN|nr:serine protease [Actinomadura barringtoniae]MBO2455697.1 trypsin-like peptidase domain-containing protein [Actinomadura barringtoniae]